MPQDQLAAPAGEEAGDTYVEVAAADFVVAMPRLVH